MLSEPVGKKKDMLLGKAVFSCTRPWCSLKSFFSALHRMDAVPRWCKLKINSIKIAVSMPPSLRFLLTVFFHSCIWPYIDICAMYTPVFQPVLKLLAWPKRGPLITTRNCHYNYHPVVLNLFHQLRTRTSPRHGSQYLQRGIQNSLRRDGNEPHSA